MARKKYGMDEARIARFIREGRGAGEGARYKPWLTISDVPSRGRSHRFHCPKTGRTHHLLSDNEYMAFLKCWWDDDVIDIREQFPILDRRETVIIAAALGIRHPVYPSSQALMVITSDLVVTKGRGAQRTTVVHAIKQAEDLKNPRICDLLEIERRWWEQRGIEWSLMTELHVKTQFTRNLSWILASGEDDGRGEEDDHVVFDVLAREAKRSNQTMPELCSDIDQRLALSGGRTLASFRRLMAAKRIRADLQRTDIIRLPASAFSFHERPL